jgi:adenylate kinase
VERRVALAAFGLWLAGTCAGQPAPKAVVLLIGPPGSGKGTQAKLITDKYGIPGISTGELLRAEAKAGTDLGKKIEAVLGKGALVSDEIVNELVAKRTLAADTAGGFILDGYPRTVAQAKFLDKLLAERRWPKPAVLHLDVPDSVVTERLTKRGRADDKPEVIRDRLKAYHRDTAPILEHYRGADLHRIGGAGTPEEVFALLDRALSERIAR